MIYAQGAAELRECGEQIVQVGEGLMHSAEQMKDPRNDKVREAQLSGNLLLRLEAIAEAASRILRKAS